MKCRSWQPSVKLASDFDKPFNLPGDSGAFVIHEMRQTGFGSGYDLKCYISNCHRGPHTLSQLRSLLLYERASTMSSFDTSTPQLKAVENLLDGFSSFNFGKVGSHLSKNYQYEAFNGVTDLAKLNKEGLTETSQRFLAGMSKLDVSTQQWGTIFNPTD